MARAPVPYGMERTGVPPVGHTASLDSEVYGRGHMGASGNITPPTPQRKTTRNGLRMGLRGFRAEPDFKGLGVCLLAKTP